MSQHRFLVADCKLTKTIKTRKSNVNRIKWLKLKSEDGDGLCEAISGYIERSLDGPSMTGSINQVWDDFEQFCLKEARTRLGVTKGALSAKRDTTWWNEKVKEKLSEKKKYFKKWQTSRSEADFLSYKQAKKEAKRAVAQAKAEANAKFYEELEDAKRDTDIFRIAKYRNNTTKDICKPRYIKDKQGKILTNDKDIGERWREYYRQLLNENFPFSNFSPEPAIAGPVQSITEIEVEDALNHMAKGKATGPDEIPVEIWKRLGNCGVRWLSELFNKILIDQCIPQRWRESYLTPFYKNKGDTRNCENYRAIKLISHTFKMWEKIINNRLKDLTSVSENQCGFVSGKSTIDAIHAIRTLMEKYDYNKQDLHFLFIDMEKAFDRVPRDLIWRAVRSQGVPEYYVEILKDMYDNIRTKVRGSFGVSGDFEVTMGVH